MQQIENGEGTAAERRVWLHLVDATDGITPETGEEDGSPEVSVNGGTWTTAVNDLVHVGNGAYYLTLDSTEVATDGTLGVRYKSSETAEFQTVVQIMSRLPGHGWTEGTALPGKDASIEAKIEFIFQYLRNKVTASSTTLRVHNAAGAQIASTSISQAGGTFTKSVMGA